MVARIGMSAVKGKEKIFPESRVDSGLGVGGGVGGESGGKKEGRSWGCRRGDSVCVRCD